MNSIRNSQNPKQSRLRGEGRGDRAAIWVLSSLPQHSADMPFLQQKGKQWFHKTCYYAQHY